jgi:ABC-type Mn2+/Zn2+ transport system ATPase subunit
MSTAPRDLVTFERATLGYGHKAVLTDLTFSIRDGDFLGLVGPNGAGKTTILRTILGSLAPMGGTVRTAEGLRFGYVPQRDAVDYAFPLSVLDVVLMGRYDRIGLARRIGRTDRELAHRALGHVGIADLADRAIGALSGGQRQRVLLARALVGEPNILVLDEPTNGMDLVSTTQILSLVRELHERDRLTVLMVSHALNEVANYVERLALVLEGAFRIGPVDRILTEATLEEMYGIPVAVERVGEHRIVVARRSPVGVGGASDA